MKATFKSVALALSVLAMVVITLMVIDANAIADVSAGKTYLRVNAVDLNNNPVHNAKVTVLGQSFNTDNKGLSPAMELSGLSNCYDENIAEWKTVTVVVSLDGYVTAVNFNCVVYVGQTRKLTVKLYPVDSSDLPYTVYVESPPDDYVKNLIAK